MISCTIITIISCFSQLTRDNILSIIGYNGCNNFDHLDICFNFFFCVLQDIGCQEACSFHDWHGGSQPSPVVEARGERALTIESGTLRWPRPTNPLSPTSPRLVYVIMRRREPGTRRTWSQLGQTPGYKARLPKTTAPCTVRVLAVSAEGLVTIYSPAPTTAAVTAPVHVPSSVSAAQTSISPFSSPTATAATLHDLRDADIIIKSLGRDQILGIRLPLAARSAPQEESLRLMVSEDFCFFFCILIICVDAKKFMEIETFLNASKQPYKQIKGISDQFFFTHLRFLICS